MGKAMKTFRHLPAFLLLFLAEGPAHGGALLSTLQERLPVPRVDSGAVYRVLQDLEKEGAVVSRWDTAESGPAKRIYTITEKGWTMLDFLAGDIKMRLQNLQFFLNTYQSLSKRVEEGEEISTFPEG